MHVVESQFPPHPQCYMAVCASCQTGTRDERVINTGIEADLGDDGFYALVYLCESCVREWGRDLGQLDKDQSEALLAEVAEKDAEIADLRTRLEAFGQLDDLIRKHGQTLQEPVDHEPEAKPAAKAKPKAPAAK